MPTATGWRISGALAVMGYVIHHGGEYELRDAHGAVLNDVIHDAGTGLTSACAVDNATGDLWAAGQWTNLVSHMSAPTQSTAHQLLASIDVTPYTQTAACGTDPSHPHAGCGAATSLVFDAAGNLYIIACSRGSISRGWSIGGMRPRR
jgi:hypothetical protein